MLSMQPSCLMTTRPIPNSRKYVRLYFAGITVGCSASVYNKSNQHKHVLRLKLDLERCHPVVHHRLRSAMGHIYA